MGGLSEVDKLGLDCAIFESLDHKVGWLDVPMNDANFM